MPDDKKIVLNLNTPILNFNGAIMKDVGSQTKTPAELLKLSPDELTKFAESLPTITVGSVLIGLLRNIKVVDLVELVHYSETLKKIENKSKNNKGIWHIEKEELLELEKVFKSTDPKNFDVVIHGQVYNIIQDLLSKSE